MIRVRSKSERALSQGERNALERVRVAAKAYTRALLALESAACAFVREGTAATSRRFPSRPVMYASAMGQRALSIGKRAPRREFDSYQFGIGDDILSIPFLDVLAQVESTLDLPPGYDGLLGGVILDAIGGKVKARK